MTISANMVKELREKTGAGMMDCKKALQEANGDMDRAIDILREKGIAKAAKKADRIAAEGLTAIHTEANSAVIVEVNCETDFVAKNNDFQEFVENVAKNILSNRPSSVEDALEKPFGDGGQTLDEAVKEKIAKIGENLSVRRFRIADKTENGTFGTYLHMGGKIGVLVVLENSTNETLAKDLAMHIAASNPRFISRSDVSSDVIEKEREILTAQALNEGKPANIVEKMVEGRLGKFYEEVCLLEQSFVKDPDKKVKQLLTENGNAQVTFFVRYEVGEGIEKKQDNFVEEVMAQAKKNQ